MVVFSSKVAKVTGVNEAILFNYLAEKCKNRGYTIPVSVTIGNICVDFPFFTKRQVSYSLNRLYDLGFISKHGTLDKNNAYTLTEIGKSYYLESDVDNVPKRSGALGLPIKRAVVVNEKKCNDFLRMCETVSNSFGFSKEVLDKLSEYFMYLAEQRIYMPKRTIQQQLYELCRVSDENKIIVIEHTIAHGWKSLIYVVTDIINNPYKYMNTDAVQSVVENVDGETVHEF